MGTKDPFSTMDIQIATNGYICHVGSLVKVYKDSSDLAYDIGNQILKDVVFDKGFRIEYKIVKLAKNE